VLLGVTAGTDLINVKVGPRNGRQIGEPISIGLDRGKLHAFDAQHHNSIMERRP